MGELAPVAGRWIGLDISSTTSGWAVVDSDGPTLVASGVIKMKRGGKDHIGVRIERLFLELGPLLLKHRPSRAMLEAGAMHSYPLAVMMLGEARGVARLCCQGVKLQLDEINPSRLKLIMAGHGRASKEQMEAVIRSLCRGCPDSFASDDESDAVACALYGVLHLQPQECPI